MLNIPTAEYIFHRAGLASLSDLKTSFYMDIFNKLEKEQGLFLGKEDFFRSKSYKWPSDSLHDFSRVWEYPYVYYHLVNYLKTLPDDSMPVVADIGSGVTFFPFSIAKNGCRVVCTDIDPICEHDLAIACKAVPHSPGAIETRLIKGNSIPLGDAECDALYCISVLEHIPNFITTITEMHRVLKPGGLCLITCDINLQEDSESQLNSAQYAQLMRLIESLFVKVYQDRTIHPLDMLTTRNSPYPRKAPKHGVGRLLWRVIKQKILKPLLGRGMGPLKISVPHVAAFGMVLIKRS